LSFKNILLVKPNARSGLGFALDTIPIGLEYIASSIRDVVNNVQIVDMQFEKHSFDNLIDNFSPDLVGITMSTADHDEVLKLAEISNKKGIKTVVGGYHPTLVPDEILSYPQIDIVVRGEGELTFRELVQKGMPNKILGICYKNNGKIIHNENRPLIKNLDDLPFPARDLRKYNYEDRMDIEGREFDVISMSRGCWGRCSFCCEPIFSRSLQRFRSPENIMKEILEVHSLHKGNPLQIFVVDPNFIGNPIITDKICNLLNKHKLDIIFSVMTRVDIIVKYPKLVKKMCENGILKYELGIESPNLKDLEDTQKDIDIETQRKAIKILRKNNAEVSGTFVIGLPGQTEEEIKCFPKYAKEIGLMHAAFGVATPFPGTKFYDDLKKSNFVLSNDLSKYDELHSVIESDALTRKRIEQLSTYCMTKFWTPDVLLDEALNYKKKTSKKIPLDVFIKNLNKKLTFIKNVGNDLFKEDVDGHIKMIFETILEDNITKYDFRNMVKIPKILNVLGTQKIQLVLRYKNYKPIHYVIKITKNNVSYMKTSFENEKNVTINFDIDLAKVIQQLDTKWEDQYFGKLKTYIKLKPTFNVNGNYNKIRLLAAITLFMSSFIVQKIINNFY